MASKRVFVASDREHAGRVIRVRGNNIQAAARAAARKLFPSDPSEHWRCGTRGCGLFVQRQTGKVDMSGVFCVYRGVQVGCLHIWEPPEGWR